MKTIIHKKYRPSKLALIWLFIIQAIWFVFYIFWTFSKKTYGDSSLFVELGFTFITSIAIMFGISLLLIAIYGLTPAVRLDDKYLSIKKGLLHPTQRIQFKDIDNIQYNNSENNIRITHNLDAQQISDIFYLHRFFYNDRQRLIQDLSEALKKHGISSNIQKR